MTDVLRIISLRVLLNMSVVLEHEARSSLVSAGALADLSIICKDQDQQSCDTEHHVCQSAGDQNSRKLSVGAGDVHQDTGREVVEQGCDGGGRGVWCTR